MAEQEQICVGSGYIYEMDFDGVTGTIPDDATIEVDANRLGYIEKGATLTYAPTTHLFKADYGYIMRNALTEESVTLKLGLISWFTSKLDRLCSTARITETTTPTGGTGRTVLIGGVRNFDGKTHLFRFVHLDPVWGDIRITIVGMNTAGIVLTYAMDASTNIEPEITATPSDTQGTLVILNMTDPVTA